MDKIERLMAHVMPGEWEVNPRAHLNNPRDKAHYEKAEYAFRKFGIKSFLDVGAFDGWLDFLLLLSDRNYNGEGVEIESSLCRMALNYSFSNGLGYRIHNGFFDDIQFGKKYDCIFSFETLEHVSLDLFDSYIEKMESLSEKLILISLPDQKHEENNQHLWTPTQEFIENKFRNKKNFEIEYKDYPGTGIPGNWFFSYTVS